MTTRTDDREELLFATAKSRLARGDIIAFATDTVYGIGVDATNADAIAKLYAAKERPSDQPMQIMAVNWAVIEQLAKVSNIARLIGEAFWPGALTMILPVHPASPLHRSASGGGNTVGLRWPADRRLQRLLRDYGKPLAVSSANRRSLAPCGNVQEIHAQFGDMLVLEGALAPDGTASTVLDLTGTDPIIVREGPITLAAIQTLLQAKENC